MRISDWSSDVCSSDLLPETFWRDQLIYQGGSDVFIGPRTPIRLAEAAWGIDFEADVAVLVDDVPIGAARDEAASAVRHPLLRNEVSLRHPIPPEHANGFDFFQDRLNCL